MSWGSCTRGSALRTTCSTRKPGELQLCFALQQSVASVSLAHMQNASSDGAVPAAIMMGCAGRERSGVCCGGCCCYHAAGPSRMPSQVLPASISPRLTANHPS
eukprot:1718158-Rhodomonas_salina.2